MRVNVRYRNDPERPLTDPVLEEGSQPFVLRIYSGDYCDPFGDPDGWFGPEKPRVVVRSTLSLMPFIAWHWDSVGALSLLAALACFALGFGFGSWSLLLLAALATMLAVIGFSSRTRVGYAGFKLYGVDSENYKTFLPPEEVYDGSQACHFSVRPFAATKKKE